MVCEPLKAAGRVALPPLPCRPTARRRAERLALLLLATTRRHYSATFSSPTGENFPPLVIAVLCLRELGGSRGRPRDGYSRKCQTSTATPAEPGELPWGLVTLSMAASSRMILRA